MEFTYENEAGEEVTVTFPTVKAVCPDCNGEGYTLRPGMKGHAYSMEEFQDSFDEEEAAEYFTRGGRYDVQCETCHGKNVVDELDEKQCKHNPALVEALKAYHDKLDHDAEYAAMCQDERRAGC